MGTEDQERRGPLKVTSIYRVEKMLSKMPPLLPNVKSLIVWKAVMGSLGKKGYQYLILANWTFPPPFFPRSALRKVWTAFDYIEKNRPEANALWKSFSYTTKSLQSCQKWKAEHFNEKHWLRFVVGSAIFPNSDIVYPWMRLQITTFLSTNYGIGIGAAPKPLEVHESLSAGFTGFSLGSSPRG